MDNYEKYQKYKLKYDMYKKSLENKYMYQDIVGGGRKLKSPLKVVLVYAPWCRHCTNFKTTWNNLISNSENVEFENHNVDNMSSEAKMKYRTDGIPTLFFEQDDSIEKYSGDMNYDTIYSEVISRQ